LRPFEEFVSKTNSSLEEKNDLFETLYKIFGSMAGNALGSFAIYAQKSNSKVTGDFAKIEKILSGV